MKKIVIALALALALAAALLTAGASSQQEEAARIIRQFPPKASLAASERYVDSVLSLSADVKAYAPLCQALRRMAAELSPAAPAPAGKLSAFVRAVETVTAADSLLRRPYSGPEVTQALASLADSIFPTKEQARHPSVMQLRDSLRNYFGITTNLRELIADIRLYRTMALEQASSPQALEEQEGYITWELRLNRIRTIPYMAATIDTLFTRVMPRDSAGAFIPEKFNMQMLDSIDAINERARATRKR